MVAMRLRPLARRGWGYAGRRFLVLVSNLTFGGAPSRAVFPNPQRVTAGKTAAFSLLDAYRIGWLGGDCFVSLEVTVENLACFLDQFGLGERLVEQDDARLQPSL